MEQDERIRWNQRYNEGTYPLEPDPFLIHAYSEFLDGRLPGRRRALDIAGGAGRHALWLAQRGWRVKLIDVSEAGITLARKSAENFPDQTRNSLSSVTSGLIETGIADLNHIRDLGREEYDLVLVFFYLQREIFPAILNALKPGGFLIYKTFTIEQQHLVGGPKDPKYLLHPGELLRAFGALRVLHYEETVASTATAELVCHKIVGTEKN